MTRVGPPRDAAPADALADGPRAGGRATAGGDPPAVGNVSAAEAEEMVRSGGARVLDVREPDEWSTLGTIPGAHLVPLDVVVSAAAALPRDGRPLLVCCEHGIRSRAAARLLATAGLPGVFNVTGGMAAWSGPCEFGRGDVDPAVGPSSWLLANADLVRGAAQGAPGEAGSEARGGPGEARSPARRAADDRPRALDVACGRGRHALLLAAAGFAVRAVDRDVAALAALGETARSLGLEVTTVAADLEAPGVDLGAARFDLVLATHYLHRPLFPALRDALKPGGILLYETYTTAQAERGHPRNPEFLLKPGELRSLAAPLEVVREREGLFEGRAVASIAARRAR